jgi:hypothetical protein
VAVAWNGSGNWQKEVVPMPKASLLVLLMPFALALPDEDKPMAKKPAERPAQPAVS